MIVVRSERVIQTARSWYREQLSKHVKQKGF